MSRWSPVYVPEIETGRHVKINACTVEIKIKWMIRKHMTYENTYHDDTFFYASCQKYTSRGNCALVFYQELESVENVTDSHHYFAVHCGFSTKKNI